MRFLPKTPLLVAALALSLPVALAAHEEAEPDLRTPSVCCQDQMDENWVGGFVRSIGSACTSPAGRPPIRRARSWASFRRSSRASTTSPS